MTNHPKRGRNMFASIRHNEAEADDDSLVLLERCYREGRFVWVESANPEVVVADGKTRTEAEAALRFVYSFPDWDLRIQKRTAFRPVNSYPRSRRVWNPRIQKRIAFRPAP